ncbi:MAG: PAS domain-containing protein [Sulfurimonas sp.]|nr:PAS domain-containing protein [Sulfurimonas sp.]
MEKEVFLDDKAFLVSETDKNGIISFANDEFCKYAGYTIEELINEPHNIVRHADMPRAAFKDLWGTVKKGNIWRGFVKNKVKDGGYYWVYATVYPFTSCNGSRGYISCRKKASKNEVEEYTKLYKQMKLKEN